MLRRLITAILAVTAFAATAVIVPVDSLSRNRQSVGLVLSGGGAKGIAHIGVIKALEENDIPIDYIAGTSMGAIVGGLYAAGYTTDEMMALLASREFTAWSTGQVNPKYMYYFSRLEPSPTLFSIPIATKSDSLAARVPSSLISPLPMNFGFMDVFAAYTAQCKGDFNWLFVPFRCVSSDVEAGHKVVHRSGSLGDAIRTSMSFPIVFQPIRVNGVLQYDGGIFDNFPVDVMEEDFSPDIMIGVDVSTPSTGPQTSLMDQIDNLVMKKQTYALPADRGIKLHIDLHQFSLLDFAKAPRIASIGYDHAMSMMDSIKGRVTARIPAIARRTARETFKAQSPYLRFDSVTVTGASPKQNRFIEYLFRPAHADTFGIVHARESFYRAVTPGRLRDLFPVATQNDSSSLFTLHLTATPKSNFTVGVGGYITSSTNSFLYASAGYNTLSFSSISANISAWLGQSYMAALANAAFILHTGIPSKIGLQAVVMRQRFFQSDRLFFEDTSPSFIVNHEYYGRLHYDLAAGARGRFCIAAGYGHLNNSFYLSDIHFPEGRAHSSYNLGQVRLSYDGGTLNDVNFPTSGSAYSFIAQGILGNYRFRMPENHTPVFSADEDDNVRWLQIESRTRNYFDISKHFAFGLESDVLLSTRKLVSSYNSAIVSATPYYPTAASHNSFTPAFRANSFVAAGLVPIYKYNASLSARLHLHGFMPVRPILEMHTGKGVMAARYGDYFSRLRFFGELDVAYTLPFATLSVYGNYTSAGSRHWNCGISLGIFIQAPRFLR